MSLRFISAYKWHLLYAAFFLAAMPDLFAPPISSTIYRQTQTAMLTENFVDSGFSFSGLSVDWAGDENRTLLLEFPVYNFIVGLFSLIFGGTIFWGKALSLVCVSVVLFFLLKITREYFSEHAAFLSALFFALNPYTTVIKTSVMPDALALAIIACGFYYFLEWRKSERIFLFLLFSVFILIGTLAKTSMVIPFVPVIAVLYLFNGTAFRRPRWIEITIVLCVMLVPYSAWEYYRQMHIDPLFTTMMSSLLLDFTVYSSTRLMIRGAGFIMFFLFSVSLFVYFIAGIVKPKRMTLLLLFSIVFYITIASASLMQGYYLWAIAPFAFVISAEGFVFLKERLWKTITGKAIVSFFLMIYAAAMVLSNLYTMRYDWLSLEASQALNQVSGQSEKAVFVMLHDRIFEFDDKHSYIPYLSERKGWNVVPRNAEEPVDSLVLRIANCKAHGASLCIVTWYTPEVEWFLSGIVPDFLKRKPSYSGLNVFEALKRQYAVVKETEQFGIVRL